MQTQAAASQQQPKRSQVGSTGVPMPASRGAKKAAQGGRKPSFRAGSPEFLSSAEYRRAGWLHTLSTTPDGVVHHDYIWQLACMTELTWLLCCPHDMCMSVTTCKEMLMLTTATPDVIETQPTKLGKQDVTC